MMDHITRRTINSQLHLDKASLQRRINLNIISCNPMESYPSGRFTAQLISPGATGNSSLCTRRSRGPGDGERCPAEKQPPGHGIPEYLTDTAERLVHNRPQK